jgi:hypothetical protein
MYYILAPECCGTFGRKTLYNGELSDVPPQIYRLHYEFTSFPTGELVSVSCIFVATESLAETVKSLNPRPTGVTFEDIAVTTTYEFRQNHPDRELPPFKWFKVTGKAGKEAVGMSADNQLVVSEAVLRSIHQRLGNCSVVQYLHS